MHYVKHFKINDVDTRQVACIELRGKPNAATEGAVGVLGIDLNSPFHEVYKCVAVNGSIYTWELLSSGMSILASTVPGDGSRSAQFSYNSLRIPSGYVVKAGDLIIDTESYLYRVISIGAGFCVAEYVGTQICIKYMESPQYSTGLAFHSNGDGTCVLRGMGNCADTNVIIPRRSPEGDIVTSIDSVAFADRANIVNIEIPDTVTSIEDGAFRGTGITSLKIPDSVTSVGVNIVMYCPNLKNVTMGSGLRVCVDFYGCSSLETIRIPYGVEEIMDYSIGANPNLKSVIIPKSVNKVGMWAFESCPNLTIYAEASEKPDGWDDNWNPDNIPVVWGAAIDIPAINDKLSNGGTGGEDTVAREMAQQAMSAAEAAERKATDANTAVQQAFRMVCIASSLSIKGFEVMELNYIDAFDVSGLGIMTDNSVYIIEFLNENEGEKYTILLSGTVDRLDSAVCGSDCRGYTPVCRTLGAAPVDGSEVWKDRDLLYFSDPDDIDYPFTMDGINCAYIWKLTQ